MNLIDNKDLFMVKGSFIKTAGINPGDEWYHNIEDPKLFIKEIKNKGIKADIFTFRQNLPDTSIIFSDYYHELESIAAIPISSYENWFKKQINKKTRQAVNKANRKGIRVEFADFDDKLIEGIKKIYDESPIRHGKPFPHYKKDIIEVERMNATYLESSEFLGAYYENELVGFIKLTHMKSYADPMQILSMLEHRDKATMNALISKVVEICANRGIPYFLYGYWSDGDFGAFKRHNGFQKFEIPRYFIPLTLKGRLALSLRLHHGTSRIIPNNIRKLLVELRKKYYNSILRNKGEKSVSKQN